MSLGEEGEGHEVAPVALDTTTPAARDVPLNTHGEGHEITPDPGMTTYMGDNQHLESTPISVRPKRRDTVGLLPDPNYLLPTPYSDGTGGTVMAGNPHFSMATTTSPSQQGASNTDKTGDPAIDPVLRVIESQKGKFTGYNPPPRAQPSEVRGGTGNIHRDWPNNQGQGEARRDMQHVCRHPSYPPQYVPMYIPYPSWPFNQQPVLGPQPPMPNVHPGEPSNYHQRDQVGRLYEIPSMHMSDYSFSPVTGAEKGYAGYANAIATPAQGERQRTPSGVGVSNPFRVTFHDRSSPTPQFGGVREERYSAPPSDPHHEIMEERRPIEPARLPKTLVYDGTEEWRPFFIIFSDLADNMGWTARERRSQLSWCLTGKAREFFANQLDHNRNLDYCLLVRSMERRFGRQELPQTALIRFQQAKQDQSEPLCEWAERVKTLAMVAYRNTPPNEVEEYMVIKFCQGCCDRDAGQTVINHRPHTLEEAVDRVRWFKHNNSAIFDTQSRPRVRFMTPNLEPEGDQVSVQAMSTTHQSRRSQGSTLGSSDDQHSMVQELNKRVASLDATVSELAKTLKDLVTARPFQRSGSPQRTTGGCFRCGSNDHFVKDCPMRSRSPTRPNYSPVQGNGKGPAQ